MENDKANVQMSEYAVAACLDPGLTGDVRSREYSRQIANLAVLTLCSAAQQGVCGVLPSRRHSQTELFLITYAEKEEGRAKRAGYQSVGAQGRWERRPSKEREPPLALLGDIRSP